MEAMQAPHQGLRMWGWRTCYRPWTRQRLLLHLHRLQWGEPAASCAVLTCQCSACYIGTVASSVVAGMPTKGLCCTGLRSALTLGLSTPGAVLLFRACRAAFTEAL